MKERLQLDSWKSCVASQLNLGQLLLKTWSDGKVNVNQGLRAILSDSRLGVTKLSFQVPAGVVNGQEIHPFLNSHLCAQITLPSAGLGDCLQCRDFGRRGTRKLHVADKNRPE